ncbi:MAG: hypothetical protein IJB85_09295 [Clostridia bacterium]|nr:hypothetical protein [Clostridia bacterium]
MKEAMYQIRKTYLAPVVILIVMLAFLLVKGTKSAYKITLWEPEMTLTQTGQIEMVATGGNLLRINSFYVDGERIEDCTVGKMTYNKCRVVLINRCFQRKIRGMKSAWAITNGELSTCSVRRYGWNGRVPDGKKAQSH